MLKYCILGPLRASLIGAACVATGCASTTYAPPVIGEAATASLPELEPTRTAQKPVTRTIGVDWFWGTTAQTNVYRNQIISKAFDDQTKKYGRAYRRMVVRRVDVQNSNPIDGNSQKASGIVTDCNKKSKNPLGRFFGHLVGYKKAKVAVLTVTVSPKPVDANPDDDYVNQFPILVVESNKDKKGTCTYAEYLDALTPFIYPETQSELHLKVGVRYSTKPSVNFGPSFNLVTEFGGLATQAPNNEFMTNATRVAESGLNSAVNNFLKNFDKERNISSFLRIPLQTDDQYPVDKYVLSFGAPTKNDSFNEIEWGQGPAFSLELEYAPTLFMNCRGIADINSCESDPAEPSEILAKVYRGGNSEPMTLKDAVGLDPDHLGNGLTGRLNKTESLDDSMARAKIGELCKEIKTTAAFPPWHALNKIDRLIFLYTWISQHRSDFVRNRQLLSEDCFSPKDGQGEKLLTSLGGPEDPIYPFPEYQLDNTGKVIALIKPLAVAFSKGADKKTELFGDSGELVIRLDRMLSNSDGDSLRNESYDGADAALALTEAKFASGWACNVETTSALTKKPTDRRFGFFQIIRDEISGGYNAEKKAAGATRGEFYAPIVVELTDDATPDNLHLRKMTIASGIPDFFQELETTPPGGRDGWTEKCFTELEQKGQREAAALAAFKDLTNGPAQ